MVHVQTEPEFIIITNIIFLHKVLQTRQNVFWRRLTIFSGKHLKLNSSRLEAREVLLHRIAIF